MKIFLSFRFTGEDPNVLSQVNKKIVEAFAKSGHQVSNSFDMQEHFSANKFTNKQIMQHTFSDLDKADALFAYINSDARSEGMLMEIGYALAKGKKVIIATKIGVKSYAPELADTAIGFSDLDELYKKLVQLNLGQISNAAI